MNHETVRHQADQPGSRGVHDSYAAPVVSPREPGEDVVAWMERIAKENGWPTSETKPRQPGEEG